MIARRRWISLVSALAMAAGASGCGRDGDDDSCVGFGLNCVVEGNPIDAAQAPPPSPAFNLPPDMQTMCGRGLKCLDVPFLADAGVRDAAADAEPDASTRSFALGFTPFPFAATVEAVNETYRILRDDADLYAFHTTQGVPWSEAEKNAEVAQYGAAIRATWQTWKTNVASGHAVYLGLTPLNDDRDGLADYWGSAEHMALPSAFANAALDSEIVRRAYLSHCLRAIAYFSPDYLAIGLEVNLLLKKRPSEWPKYVALHRYVYEEIKKQHPKLPVFASFTAVDLLAGFGDADHATQTSAVAELMPFMDLLALSFYPFMSVYQTNQIPSDSFARLAALAGGKRLAVAETGMVAQRAQLPTWQLDLQGTPEKQAAWIELVLREAEQRAMPFVVNFVARDYDALWSTLSGVEQEFATLWRDTGLYDESGRERPALRVWRDVLKRPLLR